MTKKDFELLATAFQDGIARAKEIGEDFTEERFSPDFVLEQFAETMADYLARTNPAFNRGRFLRACVPGANVRARS